MDPRDPRHGQPPNHPFSRNTQSPLYTRQPLPPPTPSSASSTPAQTAFAQPQHSQPPPSASPGAYPPDNLPRRTSDPHYFPSSRPYEPTPSLAPSNHSRHQSSSSSMTPAPPMNRPMPNPGSPPAPPGQGGGPGPGPGVQMGGGAPYGLPPPRPPVSVGGPTAFPGGRELPALGSLPRTGASGSSMSISSMLGGPAQHREPSAPSFPPPSTSGGMSAPSYSASTHASPRLNPSPADYPPYRRPHTPEQHQRMFENRDARNAAGSPHGMHMTPEMQRYGTPQTFRGPPPHMGPMDHPRDFQRGPGGPPGPPPRPSSQPKSYAPPSRPMDMGRPPHPEMYSRREELGPGIEYNPERPILVKYEEQRPLSDREKMERERFDRERFDRERFEREKFERERFEREREFDVRERERERERVHEREMRERTTSGSDAGRPHAMHPPEFGAQSLIRRDPPPPPQYGQPPDPRDQAHWQQRPPYDQPRVPYEEARPPPRQPEYPRSAAPFSHPTTGSYSQSPLDRFPPPSHPAHSQNVVHSGPPMPHHLESPDRQRGAALPPQHQQQPPRRPEDGPPPPSVAYGTSQPEIHESIQPNASGPLHLRVMEMTRNRGRISPLPQAVQGAQPQIQGPPGEAGIKSEFGRMFSGIGSGVSGLSVPSPVASGAQLPHPNNGVNRREDLDHGPQEVNHDGKTSRDNTARVKRRKAKDDDAKDEDSNGRNTPLGRTKRVKHHHHQYVSSSLVLLPHQTHIASHHHHHHLAPEQGSPQLSGMSPFKSVKGATSIPSPSGVAKDFIMNNHLAIPRSVAHGPTRDPNSRAQAPLPSPVVIIPPKPKRTISNKAVFDSIADRPREHLGDWIYAVDLKPARMQDPHTGRPPRYPYSSTPKPLPMDVIRGKEGSTLMVKVGKQHLTASAREEITARRAVWGTDIHTDDSDVVAACIHGGWIRGEWPDDVDVELLGLDEGVGADPKDLKNGKKTRGKDLAEPRPDPDYLDAPLKTGPVAVPEGRDMHVMVTILPKLEKYTSTVRFGIKSREWGGKMRDGQRSSHDGLSFMIKSVRFLTNGAGAQSRLRGQARRERMRKAMQDVAVSKSFEVRVVPNVGSGIFTLAAKEKAPSSDHDKENRSVEEGKDANTTKANQVQGPEPQGTQTDHVEQSHRDDDSGIGDVSDVTASAVPPPPLAVVPAAPGPATVASRLTPPAEP